MNNRTSRETYEAPELTAHDALLEVTAQSGSSEGPPPPPPGFEDEPQPS